MSTKPWPTPPPEKYDRFDDNPGAGWNDWYMSVIPPRARCKHGDGSCETCGTTDRRDYKHKTLGGKGIVARIPR
jgi:hypothetical protein